jgi:Gdp/GTP exchange factor required for growth at low temperatures
MLGIYLSELTSFGSLPDLIDPTAPHEPVGMDTETGALDPPAHPEVFSFLAPLPPSVQLEPFINVHKQRLIAAVIKSFVAGQHLALRVDFPVERKVWQKCFRLRGLDPNTLQRVLALYYDRES